MPDAGMTGKTEPNEVERLPWHKPEVTRLTIAMTSMPVKSDFLENPSVEDLADP
jgi:hypothetical protein